MGQLSRRVWITMLLVASVATLAAQVRDLPAGWFRAGSKPAEYEMAVDPTGGKSGGAAFIKSRTATPTADGFGTLMQQFSGEAYRGKRVRFSADVKASGISNWAGLWMRVDGPGVGNSLAFDNMQNRPIKGTLDWKRYEVVLDVAPTATNIALGILLAGPGQAWLDSVQFDVVGNDVRTTDMMASQPAKGPINLDFDK